MYTKLTHMEIPYGEIICVYGKAHMIVMEMILKFEITKLSYIENIIFEYNMNCIKVFKRSEKDLLP
jgi:hypothetical protein